MTYCVDNLGSNYKTRSPTNTYEKTLSSSRSYSKKDGKEAETDVNEGLESLSNEGNHFPRAAFI